MPKHSRADPFRPEQIPPSLDPVKPSPATRRIAGRALASWARGPRRRSKPAPRVRTLVNGLLALDEGPDDRREREERLVYRLHEARRRIAHLERANIARLAKAEAEETLEASPPAGPIAFEPLPQIGVPVVKDDPWASGFREVQGLREDALLAEVKRHVLDQIFSYNVDLAKRLTGS